MKPYRTNVLQTLASLGIRASQPPKLPVNNADNFIDARIIKTGFNPKTCRSNFQVNDYLKRGELSHARELFDQMPQKNTISTNMMISGYVKSGNLCYARELFDAMVERTVVTWTILIGGYSQCNQFREAFKLFAAMCRWGTEPDYVTFATLLSGCSDSETAN
jgi:pentatricopeptide repeat protein